MPFRFNIGDSICFTMLSNDSKIRKVIKGIVINRMVAKNQGFRMILKNNNLTHIIQNDNQFRINSTARLYTLRGVDRNQYINIDEQELSEQTILLLEFN